MSSSKTGGDHQSDRGKNCVDEDLTTKCISLPVGEEVSARPIVPIDERPWVPYVSTYVDQNPWIALNLGGIQRQTEQLVDVSRVEVTIGKSTDANFAVFVSKLSPGTWLSKCFKGGTGFCKEIRKGGGTRRREEGGDYETDERYYRQQIQNWLRGATTKLMGEKNGPFNDGETFSISSITGSGRIICRGKEYSFRWQWQSQSERQFRYCAGSYQQYISRS